MNWYWLPIPCELQLTLNIDSLHFASCSFSAKPYIYEIHNYWCLHMCTYWATWTAHAQNTMYFIKCVYFAVSSKHSHILFFFLLGYPSYQCHPSGNSLSCNSFVWPMWCNSLNILWNRKSGRMQWEKWTIRSKFAPKQIKVIKKNMWLKRVLSYSKPYLFSFKCMFP